MYVDNNELTITPRTPRQFDSVRIFLTAPRDARLKIELAPRGAVTPAQPISLPLADLLTGSHISQLDQRGNRLTRIEAIQKLFERFNVSAGEFEKAWNSFPVNQKMRVGADLARRYGITSVPTIVVNGKYRTSAADAGGYDELLELIDELTVREGLR